MRRIARGVAVLSLCGAFVFAASCTPKITQEQLNELKELKRREAMLNDDIRKKESDLSRLRSEIAARKRELDKCNEDKAFVEEKLSKWPNVWPDTK